MTGGHFQHRAEWTPLPCDASALNNLHIGMIRVSYTCKVVFKNKGYAFLLCNYFMSK